MKRWSDVKNGVKREEDVGSGEKEKRERGGGLVPNVVTKLRTCGADALKRDGGVGPKGDPMAGGRSPRPPRVSDPDTPWQPSRVGRTFFQSGCRVLPQLAAR